VVDELRQLYHRDRMRFKTNSILTLYNGDNDSMLDPVSQWVVIQSLILHELNWIESRITHLVVILWYTKTSIPFITVPFLVLPLLYHPVLCLCVVPGLYSTRTRLVVVDVGVIPFVVVVVVSFVLLSLLVSSFTTSWLCGSDTNNSELSCRVVSCKLLLFNGITNIN